MADRWRQSAVFLTEAAIDAREIAKAISEVAVEGKVTPTSSPETAEEAAKQRWLSRLDPPTWCVLEPPLPFPRPVSARPHRADPPPSYVSFFYYSRAIIAGARPPSSSTRSSRTRPRWPT